MGDEPHNYEKNKEIYDESEYLKVTAMNDFNGLFWDIFFNSIYLETKDNGRNEKIKITGNHNAEINPNVGFIIATNEFFRTINQNFFNNYQDICIEKNINNTNFQYIECNKSDIFNISSFPNIYLKSLAFETIFNLTYKDLFIVDKKNNKYIFLILTKDYFSDWVLGSVFLRKYQFVFNNDLKTIGYYRQVQHYEDDNDNLKDINKQKTVKTIIIFILIIIFSFLFVILGMIIQKKYFNKNRKLRANELEENFSYESKNNSENSLGINDDKKIINEYNDKSKYFSL
jgi:hypothetical protein